MIGFGMRVWNKGESGMRERVREREKGIDG